MRISTDMIYSEGLSSMENMQSQELQTEQEISSGESIVEPSDNPVAASQALNVQQLIDANTQYATNRNTAESQLSSTNTALSSIVTVLQNVNDTAVQAGDATLSATDRADMVTSLQSDYQQLLSLANSSNGAGGYLFSGYQVGVEPFTENADGSVTYNGDDGTSLVQVSTTGQLASNIPGSQAFMDIKNGNGTFVASAASANTGTGVISPGSVTDPAEITGDTYQITFTVTPTGTTTYDVTDTTTGTAVVTNAAYTTGTAIDINGMQTSISGAPADGDTFTLSPSSNQDVFTTIQQLINTLSEPGGDDATTTDSATVNAEITNGVNLALSNIDQAMDHFTGLQTEVGSNLSNISTLNDVGESLGTQYQDTLSNLVGVDFTAAASSLSQEETSLSAAQQAFVDVNSKTLFDYLDS